MKRTLPRGKRVLAQLLALFLLTSWALAQEEKIIWDLHLLGERLYLATGEGVRVMDLQFRQVGQVSGFPAYALASDGNRLYAASDYGLLALSPGDAPQVVARYQGFPARTLLVREGRVYLGGPGGLLVLDVAGEAIKAVGRLPGYAVFGVWVEGTQAYLATDRGLVVADLAGETPKVTAEVAVGPSYALASYGGHLYLATARGVVVFALGETPQEVARLSGFRAYRLVVYQGYLVSAGIGGLQVFALTSPSRPEPLASVQALAYTSVFLLGETLYVTSPTGLFRYAFTPPTLSLLASSEERAPTPTPTPRFQPRFGGYSAFVADKLVYLATKDGVKVMDLSDPKNPKLIGQVKGFVAHTVLLVGDLLYVGAADGLRVFKVKGPGRLEQTVFLKEKPVYAVYVKGDSVYLGTEEGLVVLVWKAGALSASGRLALGAIYALEAQNGYLYLGGLRGLFALPLGQDLKALVTLSSTPTYSLTFYQDFIYVGGTGGLWVFRLENPTRLVLVNQLPGFPAWHLMVGEGRLYVLGEGGLYVLDLGDPASPRVLVQQPGVNWTYLILVRGFLYGLGPDGVYLALWEGNELSLLGLVLNYLAALSAPPPPPPRPPEPARGWYGTYWVKTWGASGFFFAQPDTQALAVAVDAKGFVYVGGVTEGSLPGGFHQGAEDTFVAKFDPSGRLLWLRQFGTALGEGVSGITTDPQGNVYATGHTYGSLGGRSLGDWDFFVAKFDPNGKRLFLKQYGTRYWDKVTGIARDTKGNLYVGGFTYGAFPGQSNRGDRDYFLAKLDGQGNLLWVKQGGSSGGEVTLDVAFAPEGAIYLAGQTDGTLPGASRKGGDDAFLVKFDLSGKLLWARQLGTPLDDRGQSVAATAQAVYLAGTTQGSFKGGGRGTKAFVIKLDPKGNQLWVQEFGVGVVEGEESISGSAYVAVGPSGNVYLADSATGNLPGFLGAGGADVFILEYSPTGTLLSVLQSGTDDDDLAYALALSPKGEIYVVGQTGSQAFLMKPKLPLPSYVDR